jgi:hypothetical protein
LTYYVLIYEKEKNLKTKNRLNIMDRKLYHKEYYHKRYKEKKEKYVENKKNYNPVFRDFDLFNISHMKVLVYFD